MLNFYQGVMPKSVMPRRLMLQIAVGAEFKKELETYIRPQIEKGVPSMLKDLRNLYINEEKTNAILEILNKFNDNLEKQMTLCEDDEQEQDPTAQLWVYYYLANHYLFTGEYQKGFEFVDKAIEHSPTVIELYTMKAKLFKHAGNKEKAFHFYNEARKLDTADRFLNARTARYQI